MEINDKTGWASLTIELQRIIEAKLIEMEDGIKGLSWFSSVAKEYNEAKDGYYGWVDSGVKA